MNPPTPDLATWLWPTLQALPISVASLDLKANLVRWHSSAFAQLVGGTWETLSELSARLFGLQEVLRHPTHTTITVWRDGAPLEASISVHAPHCITLQLQDRVAQAQAHQRHLQDREQLLYTSRVLSIGEMATTLAHEINQPIGAATNLLQGTLMRLQREPFDSHITALLAPLQQANEQMMFVAQIIARIREYTHLHTPKRTLLNLITVLQTCARLLDWELGREHVQLHWQLGANAFWAYADEIMLQQLFVNLMRNSIDAMRSTPSHERHLSITAQSEGPYTQITISDTGSGLSEEAEKNLYTPFVSNKPHGTGIGLNICRSFIEQHEGRLWFTRPDGPGTSFHATLPAHPAPATGISRENGHQADGQQQNQPI